MRCENCGAFLFGFPEICPICKSPTNIKKNILRFLSYWVQHLIQTRSSRSVLALFLSVIPFPPTSITAIVLGTLELIAIKKNRAPVKAMNFSIISIVLGFVGIVVFALTAYFWYSIALNTLDLIKSFKPSIPRYPNEIRPI